MLQMEYIRSLHCNYERLKLEEKPDQDRYQYCILGRGGIHYLLPCSLRILDGNAYLYYDISSMQNVCKKYFHGVVDRRWMKDFLWNMKQLHLELRRFLLDDRNVLWSPEYIFQEVEKNDFYFMYVPYYGGECGFLRLVEFWVEHIDYEDEALVEFVYKAHEQFELLGSLYLEEQIFVDEKLLDKVLPTSRFAPASGAVSGDALPAYAVAEDSLAIAMPARAEAAHGQGRKRGRVQQEAASISGDMEGALRRQEAVFHLEKPKSGEGFWSRWQKKARKDKAVLRESGREKAPDEVPFKEEAYASVGEWAEHMPLTVEEYGKTQYLDMEDGEEGRLYSREGHILARMDTFPLVLGKSREAAGCVLPDLSVSRTHARICREGEILYLEDLNSTNGTFQNGLRLLPYERKRLEIGDEIRLGKVLLFYR